MPDLDVAATMEQHRPTWSGETASSAPDHCPGCSELAQEWVNATTDNPCPTYRLAEVLLRVEALIPYWRSESQGYDCCADDLAAALTGPEPAQRHYQRSVDAP